MRALRSSMPGDLGLFAVFARTLSTLWKLAPGLSLLVAGTVLIEASLSVGVLLALKRLVDALGALSADVDPWAVVMPAVYLTGALSVAYAAARAVSLYVSERYSQTISDRMDHDINRRIVSVGYGFFDQPKGHDLLSRAVLVGANRPARVVTNLLQVAQNGLLLAGLGGVLTTVHPLVLPGLVVSLLPALLVGLWFARRNYAWQRARTQAERRSNYLRWSMSERSHAKELRAFQLGPDLCEQFDDIRDRLRVQRFGIARLRMWSEIGAGVFANAVLFGFLVFLCLKAAEDSAGFGVMVLFLLVFQRGQAALMALKTGATSLYQDLLYTGQLFELFDSTTPEDDAYGGAPLPTAGGFSVELRDLRFRYPEAEHDTLAGVDLRIPAGKIVALVGGNGSGKTTLVKLLCGLYPPSAGELLVDGVPLQDMNLHDYRRAVSVVFQDFCCYQTSVAENIRYGDTRVPPGDARVEEAARRAGFLEIADRLPKGLDTLLGRTFADSEELSVGQWQRLALARAILPESRLVVLDEPASALDPDAEERLFSDLRGVIGQRSALLISHRLSSVRNADIIYVMRAGRIVESGDHAELMRQGGDYCRLFELQSRRYR